MKLHFDDKQQYQWDAIHAVTGLFEGQPLSAGNYEFSQQFGSVSFTENGFGNQLVLTEELLKVSLAVERTEADLTMFIS